MQYDLPRPGDKDWDLANPLSCYTCEGCGGKTVHIERWDAYACPTCNTWREPKCTEPACVFCFTRPDTPVGFV